MVGPVNSVAVLATALTTTEKTNSLANNVNLMLQWKNELRWVSPGVNQNGRNLYVQRSVDWFVTRLEEDIVQLMQDYGSRAEKIPLNEEGAALIQSVGRNLQDEGVSARHFSSVQNSAGRETPYFDVETITAADITANRMRVTAYMVILGSLQNLTLNLYFAETVD